MTRGDWRKSGNLQFILFLKRPTLIVVPRQMSGTAMIVSRKASPKSKFYQEPLSSYPYRYRRHSLLLKNLPLEPLPHGGGILQAVCLTF